MKKRFCALALSALMVLSLAACGGKGDETKVEEPVLTGKIQYQVSVVNGAGQPYTSGMIVSFVDANGQKQLAQVNASGVAAKELDAGEYTLEVASTDGAQLYVQPTKVTAKNPSAVLLVAYCMGEEFESISAPSLNSEESLPFDAYVVNAGSTYVTVSAGDRNYFLFSPTEAGKYEISVTGTTANIGIYGASVHYVMSSSTAEMVDGKVSTNITANMIGSGVTGTTVLVLGLDVEEGVENCVLNIHRAGDTDWTVEQEPWQNYQAKENITDYTLPSGTNLKNFDLTAATSAYQLVYNDQDGYYHLNAADGPLVFAQLSEPVYGISLTTMVGEIVYGEDGTLMQTGTAPFRYMYSNGPDDFFKEDYTDVMREYVTARDKNTGVYPLTEDLFYMLPLGIEQMGWCRSDTVNYLFAGEDINNEIAWMFLLMYEDIPVPDPNPDEDDPVENPGENDDPVENPGGNDDPVENPGGNDDPVENPGGNDDPVTSDPIKDNEDSPIEIGGTLEFSAEVQKNHIVYYNLYRVNDLILVINSKDAYVIYNGTTYEAVNGVVTVPNLKSQYTNSPVSIAIGNKGADATFQVKMNYPVGHQQNPATMQLGKTTTKVESGNEVGIFYTLTATKTGTLTITMDSCTSKFGAGILVTKVVDGIPVQTEMEDGSTTISVEVTAGDKVEIAIAANPNTRHQYPAATIETTASIA